MTFPSPDVTPQLFPTCLRITFLFSTGSFVLSLTVHTTVFDCLKDGINVPPFFVVPSGLKDEKVDDSGQSLLSPQTYPVPDLSSRHESPRPLWTLFLFGSNSSDHKTFITVLNPVIIKGRDERFTERVYLRLL